MDQLLYWQKKAVEELNINECSIWLKDSPGPGTNLVAVVGAGHLSGILKELNESHNLENLEIVPPPSSTGQF